MQFIGDEPTEANLAGAEKIDLCNECAEEKGVNDARFSMTDLLKEIKNPDRE